MPFKSPTIALPAPNRKAGTASVPQDKTAYLFRAAVGGPVPCRAERGHVLRRGWPQGRLSSPPERPPALLPADVGIKAIRHAMPVPPPFGTAGIASIPCRRPSPGCGREAEEQRHPFAEAGGPPLAGPSPPFMDTGCGAPPSISENTSLHKRMFPPPIQKTKDARFQTGTWPPGHAGPIQRAFLFLPKSPTLEGKKGR